MDAGQLASILADGQSKASGALKLRQNAVLSHMEWRVRPVAR
jgi:hypothetical protein